MKKATSFINERTVEYLLALELNRILENKDYAVIYPHQLREGSKISNEILENERFKILGIFGRRPKIVNPKDENIIVKINDVLLKYESIGRKYNIEYICGFPLSNNLFNLNKSKIIWLELKKIIEEIELIFPISNKRENRYIDEITIDKKNLLNKIDNLNRDFNIKEAMDCFKNIKRELYNYGYGNRIFGSYYKPIYILMK